MRWTPKRVETVIFISLHADALRTLVFDEDGNERRRQTTRNLSSLASRSAKLWSETNCRLFHAANTISLSLARSRLPVSAAVSKCAFVSARSFSGRNLSAIWLGGDQLRVPLPESHQSPSLLLACRPVIAGPARRELYEARSPRESARHCVQRDRRGKTKERARLKSTVLYIGGLALGQ